MVHRKWPPWRRVLDHLTINRLADQVMQSHTGVHFQYSDKTLAIRIQPVAVWWGYLGLPRNSNPYQREERPEHADLNVC